MKTICYLCVLALSLPATAREWTSTDGRTIEAKLVRVDGDDILLLMRGKEFKIPLTRLIEEDQKFALKASEAAAKEAAEAKMKLFGKKLVIGTTNHLEAELSENAQKALAGNKLAPTKVKLQILLPKGFDPDQEQMVFWPVGGINNERERLKGNLGRVGPMSRGALAAGYVVIAADTEHGNPRETTIAVQKGDHAFHSDVIEKIAAEWPQFKGWRHVCGGNSSGAKGSFYRIAQLLANDVTVVGGFFAGCNGCYASHALEETGAKQRQMKAVKAWVSTGNSDRLVSEDYNKRVVGEIESAGYGEIRNESFEGGHSMSDEEFAKALVWFKE